MASAAREYRYAHREFTTNGNLARDLDWAVRERELEHAGRMPHHKEQALPKVHRREQALVRERQPVPVLTVLGVTAVIAMAAVLMLRLLEPVLELLRQLEQVGNLRSDALELLLKAAGIGLTAEVAGLVCADAGNAALAKMLRLLGTAAILCLSVPMFTALLECITEMVGYG